MEVYKSSTVEHFSQAQAWYTGTPSRTSGLCLACLPALLPLLRIAWLALHLVCVPTSHSKVSLPS